MLIKHSKTQLFLGEGASNTAYLHGDIRRECMTPNGGKKNPGGGGSNRALRAVPAFLTQRQAGSEHYWGRQLAAAYQPVKPAAACAACCSGGSRLADAGNLTRIAIAE